MRTSVMDAQQASILQMQLRHNTEELQDYLKGLESWEEEMKAKDRGLTKNKPILKETLPPVRSPASRSSEVHKTEQQKKKRRPKPKPAPSAKSAEATRIRSFDYRSWDKFDVDRACEEVEYEVQESSGSEEDEEEQEVEEEEEEKKLRHQAVAEKEEGNALYKEGQYELAVECYSRGMMLDPLSAALPANRAMALLKLERYAAVEEDCNTALALDDGYVKAYLRRGVARRHLGKLQEAIQDFEAATRLEPGNKQASSELERTQQEQEEREKARLVSQGRVFPVKRSPHLRSKKPLKRIVIEDINSQVERSGDDSNTAVTSSAPPVGHSGNGAVAGSRGTQSPVVIDAATPAQHGSTVSTAATIASGSSTTAQDSSTKSAEDMVSTDSGVEHRSILDSSTTENGCDLSSGSSLSRDSVEGKEVRVRMEAPATLEADLPPIPQTSLQFQSHWKQLRKERRQLVAYFKRLPPSSFPVLLQQSLETDVLSDIISILVEEYAKCKVSCIDQLRWLTRVKRFAVAVMFLSKKDKERLKSLFDSLVDLCDNECDISSVKQLASDFAVKL